MQRNIAKIILLTVMIISCVAVSSAFAKVVYNGSVGSDTKIPGAQGSNTHIQAVVPVRQIAISGPTKLNAGSTGHYTVRCYPTNATTVGIRFISTNTNVATVSNSGVVKALAKGTTTIIARSVNSNATASIMLNVTEPSLALSASAISLEKGKTKTIFVSSRETGTVSEKVVWSSSNTKVATVSNGQIIAKAAGKATITASARGYKSATCTVNVTEPVKIESVLSVGIYKGSTLMGLFSTAQLSAVPRVYPMADPGESITIKISASAGDKLKSVKYAWNSNSYTTNTASTFSVKVPVSGLVKNTINLNIVSTNGLKLNCSLGFAVSAKAQIIKTAYSINGTNYRVDSTDGTGYVARTIPMIKTGVNVKVLSTIEYGSISSITYYWDNEKSVTKTYSNNPKSVTLNIPCPAWGAESSKALHISVTSNMGKTLSSSFGVGKPIPSNQYMAEFSYNGIIYQKDTVNSNGNFSSVISRTPLAVKANDIIDVHISTFDSNIEEYMFEWTGIKSTGGVAYNTASHRVGDKNDILIQVPVSDVRSLEVNELYLWVSCVNGRTFKSTFKVNRSDYVPEAVQITTTYNGQQYGIADNTGVRCNTISAQPGDKINVKVTADNGSISKITYQLENGEVGTWKLSPGSYFTDSIVGNFTYQVPNDLANGEYRLYIRVNTNQNEYILCQPIAIKKAVYNVTVKLGTEYQETTFFDYTVPAGGIFMNNGQIITVGDRIIVTGTSNVEHYNFEVRAYIDDALVVSAYSAGNTAIPNITPSNFPLHSFADGDAYIPGLPDGPHKLRVELLANNEVKINETMDIVYYSTSEGLVIDADLSKQYEYTDNLKISFNRPLLGSESLGIRVINGNKETTRVIRSSGRPTIYVPIKDLIWNSYYDNNADYRNDPIRLEFVNYEHPNLRIDTNLHSNLNILNVKNTYMNQVDEMFASMSESSNGFYPEKAVRKDNNSSVKLDEVYNPYSGPVALYPSPMRATIKFNKDGTYTKTANYGMNDNNFDSKYNYESGKAYINIPDNEIKFKGITNKAGYILSAMGNKVTQFEYTEFSKDKKIYSIEYRHGDFYDQPDMPEPIMAFQPGTSVLGKIAEHGVWIENGRKDYFAFFKPLDGNIYSCVYLDINGDIPSNFFMNGNENGLNVELSFGKNGMVNYLRPVVTGEAYSSEEELGPGEEYVTPTPSGDIVTVIPKSIVYVNGIKVNAEGTVTEKDVKVKRGDILSIQTTPNYKNVSAIEVICGQTDVKLDIKNFNAPLIVDSLYEGDTRFTVVFKYLDANGNYILDEKGNVVQKLVVDTSYTR